MVSRFAISSITGNLIENGQFVGIV
ncbi:hypothetical protein [uncultured Gimesia sp.]